MGTNAYTPWEREWSGAACAGMDVNLFILPDEKISTLDKAKRIQAAKKICKDCPLRSKCLNYAITHNVEGVWGGRSDKERHQLQQTAKMFLTPKRRSQLFL